MRKKPKQPRPKKPAAAKVVSIVGQIEQKRRAQAHAHASATHRREAELNAENKEHEAWIEDMDPDEIEAALAWCDEQGTREARVSWAELRTLRAWQSCMRGDTEAGFAEWAEVIAAEPGIAGTYLMRSRWFGKTDVPAALADCERAVAAEPNYANAYARRGDCHRVLGDPDRALADYRRAVGLDPGLSDVYYSMGTVFAGLGKLEDARVAYTRAIRLAPRYVEFYLGRAAILERLGRSDAALQDYGRILELDPSRGDIPSLRRETMLGRSGELEGVLDATGKVLGSIEGDPEMHGLFTGVGQLYALLGKKEQAIDAFDRAIALNPDDVSARAQRGRARYELDDHAGALEDFDRAVLLAPEEATHHVGRAHALGKLGRLADAVLATSRAIELSPDDGGLYFLRSIYVSHAEEGLEALARVKADLARAIELARSGDVSFHRERVDLLMVNSEYTEALADIEKALAIVPRDATLHYQRGCCKSRLDEELPERDPPFDESEADRQARCTSALADLEKALELGKRDEDVYHEMVCVRERMGDEDALLAALDRALAAFPDMLRCLSVRSDRRRRRGDAVGAAADRARLVELGVQLGDDA